ncbi:hypothetical protein [Kutzneria sp. 744]|nr:hypothetical protein [Kutzneria sp. 744]
MTLQPAVQLPVRQEIALAVRPVVIQPQTVRLSRVWADQGVGMAHDQ